MPLVSIITPTYNRKELLEKAILSVINQKQDTPFDWEMIIVDDGSKDGTGEYIQRYLREYPENIQYSYQENRGVGKARNVGIERMSKKSDYIIFLDSDDELVEDCISICLKKFEELKTRWEYEKTVIIVFYCRKDTGELIWTTNIFNGKTEIKLTYEVYLENIVYWETGSIFKSSLYRNNPDFRFPEDVITESVLWSKIWRKLGIEQQCGVMIDYIGRIYGTSGPQNQNKITQEINIERFKKNAIGNERMIENIGADLNRFWFKKAYSEYAFRAGVNWILFGEKKRGLTLLKTALRNNFSMRNLWIYIFSILSRNIVLWIYKMYI